MGGAGAMRCRAPARAPISLLLLAHVGAPRKSVQMWLPVSEQCGMTLKARSRAGASRLENAPAIGSGRGNVPGTALAREEFGGPVRGNRGDPHRPAPRSPGL